MISESALLIGCNPDILWEICKNNSVLHKRMIKASSGYARYCTNTLKIEEYWKLKFRVKLMQIGILHYGLKKGAHIMEPRNWDNERNYFYSIKELEGLYDQAKSIVASAFNLCYDLDGKKGKTYLPLLHSIMDAVQQLSYICNEIDLCQFVMFDTYEEYDAHEREAYEAMQTARYRDQFEDEEYMERYYQHLLQDADNSDELI